LEIPNGAVQSFLTQGYTCGYGHTDCLSIAAPDVNHAYVFGGPGIPVGQVTMSSTSLILYMGSTHTLTTTVLPAGAHNGMEWSSDNTAVLTVNASGVLTPVAVGTATVTANATDNSGRKATCTVTVLQHVTSVSLRITKLSIGVGGTATVVADVLPANAANKTVTWSSDNPTVATVNATTGVITGVSGPHGGDHEGSFATITATTVDGSKKATCQVHVYPAVYFGEDHQKAVTPTLNSDAYKAKSLKNKFLDVAASQVGYRNGHDSGWHTTVTFPYSSGSGWSKYPAYYGSTIQNDNDLAWCASFVSWCAELSGVGSSIYRTRGSKEMRDKCGTFVSKTAANSTNVKAGDLVYFSTNSYDSGIYHVGIVRSDYTGNGEVQTVEGNTQNGDGGTAGYCANRTRSLSSSGICGFSHITF
jgi:hypothetical protein